MLYNCRTLVGTGTLMWNLPNGETDGLIFTGGTPIGTNRTSEDGNFIATLISRTGVDINVMFVSILMIREAMNYTMNLTCIPGSGDPGTTMIVVSGKFDFYGPWQEITECFPKRDEYPNLSQEATCTIASLLECGSFILPSGPPDPPSDLGYNDGVVIESSVDLQWTRPSYTGGVDIMNYTVSANGRRLEVMDDSETVMYHADPDVVYGEVQVSAINTCGQESQPAVINIPAEGLYSKFTDNTDISSFLAYGFHFHYE